MKTTGCTTMSVFKRKTSSGTTYEYHYRFMKNGKLYYGVCHGCSNKEEALEFELKIKQTANQLAMQKNVRALIENFRDELSGGEKILLEDAFDYASSKPQRIVPSEKHLKNKKSRFQDFVLFMKNKHPDIKYANQVTQKHAEEYISQLRSKGRYSKTNVENLSTSTLNRYLEELKRTFNMLDVLDNPFAKIDLLIESPETREAFSEKELELILKNAPDFIRDIFIVGLFTALREGDICTLKWTDVIWDLGIIRRKLKKTGNIVEIPIMPPLREFLEKKLKTNNNTEYILPEHAKMYIDNPYGITYRVKKNLESIGIKTTKKVPGRTKAVSIKDVHSLRHTFCYMAGVAGIPLVVVQSIVGHMTPEMTAHYTAHADRDTKREKMLMLPYMTGIIKKTYRALLTEQKREDLIHKIKTSDRETIDRIADKIAEC